MECSEHSDPNLPQVFLGTPHRSVDHFGMEDTLSRFLFGSYDSEVAEIRPSASSIPGFAAAAMEINGLFVESKILLRSRAVSVYHQEGSNSKVNKVRLELHMKQHETMRSNIKSKGV